MILITGGNGALGSELEKIFPENLMPNHEILDVTKKEKVSKFFKEHEIDTIIHAAALTKIRPCEENKELAWKTNVEGTRNLVETVLETKKNIQFIYISTACVFDGHSGMYDENSIPYPENFYALTKLIAEHEVSKLENFLIIRTNFVPKKKWPYPKAFRDRFGTYLFAEDVAKAIKEVIQENIKGTIHVVGDKKMSMLELAKITTPDIEPMGISEYSGPKLTMDMSLDSKRWKKYKISK
jgi:dTDP-4-dehydrorhamnose reductase